MYSSTFGLISLNSLHKTHNIPGKFMSYMQAGLPTLSILNMGNDLIDIINNNNVGLAITSTEDNSLINAANQVLLLDNKKVMIGSNFLLNEFFLAKCSAKKIQSALGQ